MSILVTQKGRHATHVYDDLYDPHLGRLRAAVSLWEDCLLLFTSCRRVKTDGGFFPQMDLRRYFKRFEPQTHVHVLSRMFNASSTATLSSIRSTHVVVIELYTSVVVLHRPLHNRNCRNNGQTQHMADDSHPCPLILLLSQLYPIRSLLSTYNNPAHLLHISCIPTTNKGP